ncbi:MAG: glucose-6-phosphate isomerase, partial [Fusobacteriaceae bacterium]
MKKLKFDYKNSLKFFGEHEIKYLKESVNLAAKILHEKTGAGNDFLGWVNLPTDYDKAEFERIKIAAEKIKNNSEILLVVGIGGSYL